ncbi:MAG: 2-hydroxyglutaryl-CoA dehydratase [Candidatus Aminicenantes bacterium]|nr:MAG: 2-hydroxyglutaryl-CoA dehydratase [Candidatus Aminicenantes bacterium]
MEFFLGIDIGSSSTKGVILDMEKNILAKRVIRTKPKHSDGVEIIIESIIKDIRSSLNSSNREVSREDIKHCIGTGYGRNNIDCADKVITEITCHAKGANYYFPYAKTVIDIGGQDSKVIRIDNEGKVIDFVMNDKCAAGTGRFLEAACKILKVPLEEFGKISRRATSPCKISSTCVVFAESEIISKLAEGVKSESIAKGIHHAMVSRLLSMGKRIRIHPPIVFTGGVAENEGMVEEVVTLLGIEKTAMWVPDEPKIIGALGAALFAYEEWNGGTQK